MTATTQPNNVRKILGQHILTDGFEIVIDLQKSHGSWIVDALSGKEYLDLFSMFASMSIGYNHPFITEQKALLGEVAVNKPTLSDIYSAEYADFVDTFSKYGIPDYLKFAFFIEGGGLAVENALKTAFDWKVRKNLKAGKGEKGSKVIHFEKCFHGRTGYTMSLTDSPDPRKTLYFPKFDWPRIPHPTVHFPLTDTAAIEELEQQSLARIKDAIMQNPDDIAALIIEPIQGEGGDNHMRSEFARQLRQICDEEEIILIYDEIQTGVGITGKFWAYEHFGPDALPDIISFGKKSQVCGILAGDRITENENHVFAESSRINSTFGGNLIDMMRFNLIMQVIARENLIDNARIQGAYLAGKLQSLADEFPGYVTNPRGTGLFAAFDLPSGTERDQVIAAAFDKGAIILGCGASTIRFRPHLNIAADEIDTAVNIISDAIRSCLV